jgi:hypothetical protein
MEMRSQQKRKIIEGMGCATGTCYQDQRPTGTTPIQGFDFDARFRGDETNLVRRGVVPVFGSRN